MVNLWILNLFTVSPLVLFLSLLGRLNIPFPASASACMSEALLSCWLLFLKGSVLRTDSSLRLLLLLVYCPTKYLALFILSHFNFYFHSWQTAVLNIHSGIFKLCPMVKMCKRSDVHRRVLPRTWCRKQAQKKGVGQWGKVTHDYQVCFEKKPVPGKKKTKPPKLCLGESLRHHWILIHHWCIGLEHQPISSLKFHS